MVALLLYRKAYPVEVALELPRAHQSRRPTGPEAIEYGKTPFSLSVQLHVQKFMTLDVGRWRIEWAEVF